MSDPNEGLEREVLQKKRYDFEQPTSTHFTLEVAAYWDQGLLQMTESGRRRKVTVGGYGQDALLRVELPNESVRAYTIAHIRMKEATIVIPEEAQVALRTKDGEIVSEVQRVAASAPFPAFGVVIGFGERLAFRTGKLTFACQFIRWDGPARTGWDWLIPQWWGR